MSKKKSGRLPSPPIEDPPQEEKVGYLTNLEQEELDALEARKAAAAATVVAARERAALARAKESFAAKKAEWQKKKAYVKGSKVCEQNRIYEDAGWYICEVCNKKLQDIEWVDQHVATDKHKNNMEWYSKHPLPDSNGTGSGFWGSPELDTDEPTNLPEYIQWDEVEMFFNCTLCKAKAACEAILQAHINGKEHTKRLLNPHWYIEGIPAPGSAPTSSNGSQSDALPPYCEWDTSDGQLVCRWCEKKAFSMEFMKTHLDGNEHTKKCCNIGIPAYSEPGHLEQAQAYVDQYKFDVWCRQHHWPGFIVDEPNCWHCTECRKKFLVPSAVNDHLKEKHTGGSHPTSKQSSAGPPAFPKRKLKAPTQTWFDCDICQLPFDSKAELDLHELHDRTHQMVIRRLSENAPPLIEFEDI